MEKAKTIDLASFDMNGDEAINICDVVLLNEILIKGEPTNGCDVNGDGKVDALDATAIRNMILS